MRSFLFYMLTISLLLAACNNSEEPIARNQPGANLSDTEQNNSGSIDDQGAVEGAQLGTGSSAESPSSENAGQDNGVNNSSATEVPPQTSPQLAEEIPEGLEPLATLAADESAGEPILVTNPELPGRLVFLYVDITSQEPTMLYMMQADGSDLVQLSDEPANYANLDWYPASEQFGMKISEPGSTGQPQIFLVNADGSGVSALSFHGVDISSFQQIPGSQEIMFRGSEKSTASNIYRGNIAEGSYEAVMPIDFRTSGLAWSSSGRYIVFHCSKDSGLCLLDLQNPGETQELDWTSIDGLLLDRQKDNLPHPSMTTWSPDDSKIAFALVFSIEIDDTELCVLDIASDEGVCWPAPEAVFANGIGNRPNLTWSPDGNYLAYTAYFATDAAEEGKLPLSNIAAIDINTGEFFKLTSSNAPDTSTLPLWISDEPPIDGPIIKLDDLLPARIDAGESFMDPNVRETLDNLSEPGAIQALIQAFADNDRVSFDYLIDRTRASIDEVWNAMGEGCRGVDASIFSYELDEDGITLKEYVVKWEGETVGHFLTRRRSDDTTKIVEGTANCGGSASAPSNSAATSTPEIESQATPVSSSNETAETAVTDVSPSPTPDAEGAVPAANYLAQSSADINAQTNDTAITIDGDISDWTTREIFESNHLVYSIDNWDGTNDLQVTWRFTWDNDALYVSASVTDDIHVQTRSDEQIHRGDSLEMQIDTDVEGDWQTVGLNTDDFQIALSPGDFVNVPPVVRRFRGQENGSMVEFPGHSIEMAATSTLEGYILELAIPWSDFSVTPEPGLVLGIALNANDNDTPGSAVQEVMMSSAPDRVFNDPHTWGTLTLN